jgi:branched-chain amino acid transport system ATP-binding protein
MEATAAPSQQPAAPGGASILEAQSVSKVFGGLVAVDGVDFRVPELGIVSIIGPNGAGKTTFFNTLTGLYKPTAGVITFQGEDITDKPAHEIVHMGISQSPEGRRVFPRMSVLENLEMGAYQRDDRSEIGQDLDRVYALFPRLEERKSQKAGTLSGGEQQMLAIGRALMARPKLLLLDEPGMGLAPILVERIYETIQEINRQGTTILLVEQNANFALEVAARGYVLETGAVALTDESGALRKNPDVQRAYLGT